MKALHHFWPETLRHTLQELHDASMGQRGLALIHMLLLLLRIVHLKMPRKCLVRLLRRPTCCNHLLSNGSSVTLVMRAAISLRKAFTSTMRNGLRGS